MWWLPHHQLDKPCNKTTSKNHSKSHQAKLNSEVSSNQFGFRPNSGTREAIFCMRMTTERYLCMQRNIYACFIDYSKAFDKVHHNKLIDSLMKVNTDGKDIHLIIGIHIYWQQMAAIRINNSMSDFIAIKRGVRQGCVLSLLLWNWKQPSWMSPRVYNVEFATSYVIHSESMQLTACHQYGLNTTTKLDCTKRNSAVSSK